MTWHDDYRVYVHSLGQRHNAIGVSIYRVKKETGKDKWEVLEVDESDATGGTFRFREVDIFEVTEPTLVLDKRSPEPQALMDRLWSCGLRPTEGSGSAGSLAATERHLADLRKLLFHREGIPNG